MKRLFILLTVIVLSINVYAQTPENPEEETVTIFAVIKGEESGSVSVDYGDGDYEALLTDDGAKFKSLVSALNYLSAKGWIYKDSFSNEEDHYIIVYKEVRSEVAKVIIDKGVKRKAKK